MLNPTYPIIKKEVALQIISKIKFREITTHLIIHRHIQAEL